MFVCSTHRNPKVIDECSALDCSLDYCRDSCLFSSFFGDSNWKKHFEDVTCMRYCGKMFNCIFRCPPLMEITLGNLEAFLQASRSYLTKHMQVCVKILVEFPPDIWVVCRHDTWTLFNWDEFFACIWRMKSALCPTCFMVEILSNNKIAADLIVLDSSQSLSRPLKC